MKSLNGNDVNISHEYYLNIVFPLFYSNLLKREYKRNLIQIYFSFFFLLIIYFTLCDLIFLFIK